jgi:hypothetical protein
MRLIAVLACAALTVPSTVFAQAGSTGGVIGKQDKSLSGGNDTNLKSKPSQATLQEAISGTWTWYAQCGGVVGAQSASFALNQVSATSFKGQFVGTNTWGTIVNGKVNGSQLSFDRLGGPLGVSEHWRARLSGNSQMEGSSVGAVNCTFTANK